MTLIKILIELNDKKFAIYVESDKRQLKSVCHEISRQTKQLVSFESHFFEVLTQLIVLLSVVFIDLFVFRFTTKTSENMFRS